MSFRRTYEQKLEILRKAGLPAIKENLPFLRGKSKWKKKGKRL